ncbi:MAG: hypothetical protein ACRDSN_04340 [Pseudonocardiaceae bacterium]
MFVFAHAALADPLSAGAVVISAVLTYVLAVVVPGLFLVLIGRFWHQPLTRPVGTYFLLATGSFVLWVAGFGDRVGMVVFTLVLMLVGLVMLRRSRPGTGDRPVSAWVILAAVWPPALVGLSHLGVGPSALVGSVAGSVIGLFWYHRIQRARRVRSSR